MSTTAEAPIAETPSGGDVPLVELKDVGKSYGNIIALKDINLRVRCRQVTGVLGDNGAGKSTLIKIIAGLHKPTEGELLVDGEAMTFDSPKDALANGHRDGVPGPGRRAADAGVAQLLPRPGAAQEGFLKSLDTNAMRATTISELKKMGIDLPDVDAPIGSLSGGQRQCVAIARAVFFGARVLILDEPTAALGVKQSGVVLRYITAAKEQGFGVIFITHNPHHAHMVGDHFVLLNRGTAEAGLHLRRDRPGTPHPGDGRRRRTRGADPRTGPQVDFQTQDPVGCTAGGVLSCSARRVRFTGSAKDHCETGSCRTIDVMLPPPVGG